MFIIILLAMLATSACVQQYHNNLFYWDGYHKKGGEVGYSWNEFDRTKYLEHGNGLPSPHWDLVLQYFVPAGKKAYVLQQGKKKSAPSAWPVVLSEDACYYAGKIIARGKFTTEHDWIGYKGENEGDDNNVNFKFYGSTQRWASWTFIEGGVTKKLNYLQWVTGPALVMSKDTDKWATVCDGRKCSYKGVKFASGGWECDRKACPSDCCKDKHCCKKKELCGIDGSCTMPAACNSQKCKSDPRDCIFSKCDDGSDGERCCKDFCQPNGIMLQCMNSTMIQNGQVLHWCSCMCDNTGYSTSYMCSTPSNLLMRRRAKG